MAPKRTEQNQKPAGICSGPAVHLAVFEEPRGLVGRGTDIADNMDEHSPFRWWSGRASWRRKA